MKGPSVVIIGSGPGGFYAAESISKKLNSDIDIIDRLPTPFGLIRGGVAPDHQTTKKISLTYTKTAKKDQIRFFGNIEIGKDVSLDELRKIYDVVILAIGSELDNKLEIGKICTIKVQVKKYNIPRIRNLPNTIKCEDLTGQIEIVFFNSREGYLKKIFFEK